MKNTTVFEKIELEPQEEILITVRKHWFVILSELIGVLLMVLIPLLVLIVFGLTQRIEEYVTIHQSYLQLAAFFIVVWILLAILTGFTIWTHYFLDLWLITDRRIIVIDQVHFFNRKISSFRLERLQDIKVVISGIIPTFLNFGTLHAHTADNREENFTTTGLPDPRGLQAIIQKATDARLREIGTIHQLTP